MKKFFVIAIAALCACSSTVFAQKPADNTATNGCPLNKECKRGDKAKCNKADRKAFNPFEGITLTADQQTKLNALKAECKAQREACKGRANCPQQANCDKNCKPGENCAKTECPVAAGNDKAVANRQQQRRDCLNKVKAILTPEQYVTFLENMAVSRPAGHHGDKAKMARHDRKCHGMRHCSQGKAVSAQTDKAAKN